MISIFYTDPTRVSARQTPESVSTHVGFPTVVA